MVGIKEQLCLLLPASKFKINKITIYFVFILYTDVKLLNHFAMVLLISWVEQCFVQGFGVWHG